ncbi:MAG: tetratricopeptide repeat protein [Rhodanobacter sp.]
MFSVIALRGALSCSLAAGFIAGCSLLAPAPQPAAPSAVAVPGYDLVAAIRAAGDRETSIIAVNALRDPGITALHDTAARQERAGHYAQAATALDDALKLSPESPDLLQDRAEIAVRQKDFSAAEKYAHQSWSLGPKLGPLCARNWQTIVEMRLQARDQSGADTARKWVQQCHKAGIPRY